MTAHGCDYSRSVGRWLARRHQQVLGVGVGGLLCHASSSTARHLCSPPSPFHLQDHPDLQRGHGLDKTESTKRI